MEDVISLGQALAIIDSGVRHSISFYTADRKRGTAGEKKFIPHAAKHGIGQHSTANTVAVPRIEGETRAPHHYFNSTRNLVDLQNRKVTKVHIRLLQTINGKRIL